MTPPPYLSQALPTPFDSRTAPLCISNEWVRWAGFRTVNWFSGVEDEYFAIRNAASVYDISPMIKYLVTGPDAARYMNRLIPRDVAKIGSGRVVYTVWCDDGGKVLDDGTVFRFDETTFRLNAQERHLTWLLDSAHGFDVSIADVSEETAGLALQGPTSCAVLRALGLANIGDLRPFGIARFDFMGIPLTVSRTGFTGDLGYELWIAPDHAEELWDRLMEAGGLHGIRPVGSRALDMARIEAGIIQTPTDFVGAQDALRASRRRTPFDLSLEWMLDFDKGHFNGRRALLAERATGPRWRIVGLDVAGNKPANDALIYSRGRKREIGFVTSAMWSPTCKRNIALATIEAGYAEKPGGLWADVYFRKELKWERGEAPCRIVRRPFFDHPRRRATPPADR